MGPGEPLQIVIKITSQVKVINVFVAHVLGSLVLLRFSSAFSSPIPTWQPSANRVLWNESHKILETQTDESPVLLIKWRIHRTSVSLQTLLNYSSSRVQADSGNLPGRGAASCYRHETFNNKKCKDFKNKTADVYNNMFFGNHNQDRITHWSIRPPLFNAGNSP